MHATTCLNILHASAAQLLSAHAERSQLTYVSKQGRVHLHGFSGSAKWSVPSIERVRRCAAARDVHPGGGAHEIQMGGVHQDAHWPCADVHFTRCMAKIRKPIPGDWMCGLVFSGAFAALHVSRASGNQLCRRVDADCHIGWRGA